MLQAKTAINYAFSRRIQVSVLTRYSAMYFFVLAPLVVASFAPGKAFCKKTEGVKRFQTAPQLRVLLHLSNERCSRPLLRCSYRPYPPLRPNPLWCGFLTSRDTYWKAVYPHTSHVLWGNLRNLGFDCVRRSPRRLWTWTSCKPMRMGGVASVARLSPQTRRLRQWPKWWKKAKQVFPLDHSLAAVAGAGVPVASRRWNAG